MGDSYQFEYGTPIKDRLKAVSREALWSLMTYGGKALYYLGPTGAGALYGWSKGHPLEGALIGTAARLTPWAAKKAKKIAEDSFFKIPDGMVGVVFRKGRLFDKGEADNLIKEFLINRNISKGTFEEESVEEKFYKNNKSKFRFGSKIVGRGRHCKLPGARYIAVDTDTYPLDPEPKIVTTKTKNGVPVEMQIDLKVMYRKLPLLFAFINKGKLFRGDENWEKTLEVELIDEAHDLIGEYFENSKFPDVLDRTLSAVQKDELRKRIVHEYGVEMRILREAKNFPPSQEGSLREAIAELQSRAALGEIYREDYLKTVESIQSLTEGKSFSPDFYKHLEEARKFRESSLERLTLKQSK